MLPPFFFVGSIVNSSGSEGKKSRAAKREVSLRNAVLGLVAAIVAAVAILCIATVVRLRMSHELIVSVAVTVSVVMIAAGLIALTFEGGKLLLSYGKFRLQVIGVGLALCIVGIVALFYADRLMPPAQHSPTPARSGAASLHP